MKNATEILLLIDASASMGSLQTTTIESVNSFIKEQQSIEGEAYLTIAQFNHSSRIVAEGDIASIQPITNQSYNPQGATALADALIDHITGLGRKLGNIPESERPNKVVFVIITDGQENASENLMETAVIKIKHQETVYNWNFIYLAAGLAAIKQGNSMSLSINQIVAFNHNPDSYKAVYSMTSNSIARFRSSGIASDLSLTSDDRSAILNN